MNIYKEGSRQRLSFSTVRGNSSLNDLWSLTLNQLDETYKSLNKEIRALNEDSLLKSSRTKVSATIQLKFDLVEDIMLTKMKEQEDRLALQENKERTQYLLELKKIKEKDRHLKMTEKVIDAELARLKLTEVTLS